MKLAGRLAAFGFDGPAKGRWAFRHPVTVIQP
jgi:hypothetical protein